MKSRLPKLTLAALLIALIGWPILATILSARSDRSTTASGGLMTPMSSSFGTADLARPARLAAETLRLVLATALFAFPVGLPLAFLLFRTDAWGRRFSLGLLVVSALVPLPLHATAWLSAFGNAGRARAFGVAPWIVGWPGAAFLHAAAALPWVVLVVGAGLLTVEPELEESALLDMPPWRVALRVSLRRALGAIAAAAFAIGILTAGDMTITDILQVRTYAEEAYFQYSLGNGAAAAAAVALPPLLALGALILLGTRALLDADPARLASAVTRSKIWSLGPYRFLIGFAILLAILAFIAIPLSSLVWHAGRVGRSARIGPPAWSLPGLIGTISRSWDDASGPLLLSAGLAVATATSAIALAWPLAWLSRYPGPWRWVALLTVAITLAAPGPVAGMSLVLAYGAIPWVYDSPLILILAQLLRTLPYALLILWPAVHTIPEELLEAAEIEGLTPSTLIRRVALPMTSNPLIAAWLIAFALALGELPATNIVTPPGLMPLTGVIWSMLHTGVESRLAGIVLIMLAVVSIAALLAAIVLRRILPSRE